MQTFDEAKTFLKRKLEEGVVLNYSVNTPLTKATLTNAERLYTIPKAMETIITEALK